MIGGSVDVGDHRIDRGVGIGKQTRRIAADRPEAADRMAKLEQAGIAVGYRSRGPVVTGRRQARQDSAHAPDTPAADADLAEEQVDHYSHHRHGADDDEPGDARGRIAVRPQQNSRHDREVGQSEQNFDQRGREDRLHG